MEISREDVEFMDEAVKVFEEDPTVIFRISKDELSIALRWGAGNDCIKLYRLNGEYAFIANYTPQVSLKTIVQEG